MRPLRYNGMIAVPTYRCFWPQCPHMNSSLFYVQCLLNYLTIFMFKALRDIQDVFQVFSMSTSKWKQKMDEHMNLHCIQVLACTAVYKTSACNLSKTQTTTRDTTEKSSQVNLVDSFSNKPPAPCHWVIPRCTETGWMIHCWLNSGKHSRPDWSVLCFFS